MDRRAVIDVAKLRAQALSISVRAPMLDDEQTDALAVDLTAHLIGFDTALGEALTTDVEAAIYQPSSPIVDHLLGYAKAFLAPKFGTAPIITLKRLVRECYTLAVFVARGEA